MVPYATPPHDPHLCGHQACSPPPTLLCSLTCLSPPNKRRRACKARAYMLLPHPSPSCIPSQRPEGTFPTPNSLHFQLLVSMRFALGSYTSGKSQPG
jgi:hypothetical protein